MLTWLREKLWFLSFQEKVKVERSLPFNDGVNVLIVDKNDGVLEQYKDAFPFLTSFKESAHEHALVLTDKSKDEEGELDNWILRRTINPENVTYVFIDKQNLDFYQGTSFQNLLRQQELLNVAIYLIVPWRNLTKSIVDKSTRVVLYVKARKPSSAERQQLFSFFHIDKNITYLDFLHHWQHSNKHRNKTLIENGELHTIS